MVEQPTTHTTLEPVRLRTAAPPVHPRGAVFLDRDGVLNDVRGAGDASLPPRRIEELAIASDAPSSVDRLRAAGFVLIVVTNQPDVARGTMTLDAAVQVTGAVADALALDDGYVCAHDGPDGCDCRKPRPGMLTRAGRDWDLALDHCWLIGDRWVDVAAAEGAGVRPVLLERSYSWDRSGGANAPPGLTPEFRGATLGACVSYVLAGS